LASHQVAADVKEFFKQLIAEHGPLPIDRYMALCLGHPKFGYYMTRDPFGAAGDFTTAPEISQVFGELLGVWCVAAWEAVGSPSPFALVELGPGRGTLMADILRATAGMADFRAAAQVHLVEMSPVLQALQEEKLGRAVTWHLSIDSLPDQPIIFVANEFFDALPARQLIKRSGAWTERHVALEQGELALAEILTLGVPGQADGIYELSPISGAIAQELGAKLQALGGAGLIIDYGHLKSAAGDTLQALKSHKPVGVLDFPGSSDLTAHVDFESLAQGFVAGGAEALPPMTQSKFLKAMGIDMRVQRLAQKLTGKDAEDFVAGAARLVDDGQMGQLFKVLSVAQTGHGPIYPFEV
jgi:NADH dehydrogenase [ubiquinone] 1 alpha subcomplex assembly factor 7